MGATPEPERENREQEWHETPHQAGSSQIRRCESKIYPGFCNRAASTVADGSPGWWGFRELKSSNVKMLQGAETAFFIPVSARHFASMLRMLPPGLQSLGSRGNHFNSGTF
jgi:hypothetical protein